MSIKKAVTEIVDGHTITLEHKPENEQRHEAFVLSVNGVPRLAYGINHTECHEALAGEIPLETLIVNVQPKYLHG